MLRVIEDRGQKNDSGPLAGAINPSVSVNSVIARDTSSNELADTVIPQADLIDQLNSNIDRLTDLQARTQFLVRELRSLIRS